MCQVEMLDLNDRKAGGLSHVMLVEPIQVTSVDLVGTSRVESYRSFFTGLA